MSGEFEFESGRGIFSGEMELEFGTLGLGMGDLAVRASMEKGGLGTVKFLDALDDTAAAMEDAMEATLTGFAAALDPMPTELADSLVEVVQSLETDFLPSECVGETGKTCFGERSRGLSSRTLSTSFLKSVCRRYWMAGRRKAASSGRSGTKKQTSSVLASTSFRGIHH